MKETAAEALLRMDSDGRFRRTLARLGAEGLVARKGGSWAGGGEYTGLAIGMAECADALCNFVYEVDVTERDSERVAPYGEVMLRYAELAHDLALGYEGLSELFGDGKQRCFEYPFVSAMMLYQFAGDMFSPFRMWREKGIGIDDILDARPDPAMVLCLMWDADALNMRADIELWLAEERKGRLLNLRAQALIDLWEGCLSVMESRVVRNDELLLHGALRVREASEMLSMARDETSGGFVRLAAIAFASEFVRLPPMEDDDERGETWPLEVLERS